MGKSKMFSIIVVLAILLIGCVSNKGMAVGGEIIEVNEESGDMKLETVYWTIVSEPGSSTDSSEFKEELKSEAITIRVSKPENYDVGEEIEVKVIKNYEEDVWDLNRLAFEVTEKS
ncbi:hypothetical protein [Halobacillus litoralis]|uniref:hypothetical protein n=1 Tax=Halobacillus litoralis TaxID=45668 RepID=UPI00248F6B6A|nr:hypothetical protein [Halobacillus litoralis]